MRESNPPVDTKALALDVLMTIRDTLEIVKDPAAIRAGVGELVAAKRDAEEALAAADAMEISAKSAQAMASAEISAAAQATADAEALAEKVAERNRASQQLERECRERAKALDAREAGLAAREADQARWVEQLAAREAKVGQTERDVERLRDELSRRLDAVKAAAGV